MKNRSMLCCLMILLCIVICGTLSGCAGAEETKTLFDNTDYITDVSELIMSSDSYLCAYYFMIQSVSKTKTATAINAR